MHSMTGRKGLQRTSGKWRAAQVRLDAQSIWSLLRKQVLSDGSRAVTMLVAMFASASVSGRIPENKLCRDGMPPADAPMACSACAANTIKNGSAAPSLPNRVPFICFVDLRDMTGNTASHALRRCAIPSPRYTTPMFNLHARVRGDAIKRI
jgi:hypothetical protein